MKKRILIKSILILILISFYSLAFFSYKVGALKFISYSGVKSPSPHIVLDSFDYLKLPKNFRMAKDILDLNNSELINVSGVQQLNISGSAQFSGFNLPLIIEKINTDKKIISVDLRQEAHGFINSLPVSLLSTERTPHMGISKEAIIKNQSRQLKSIPLDKAISFYNHGSITIVPDKIQDERQLTKTNSTGYEYLPVAEGRLPTLETVDAFINFVRKQPDSSWLHFHCKDGIERTTTFMIMYDMMKNFNKASAKEIIKRQVTLADLSPEDAAVFLDEKRSKFLMDFYSYCSLYGFQFKSSFTSFIKNN